MTETPLAYPPDEQNALLACIGHVCLQWALLEQTVLFIIGAIENIPITKAYTMFSGLDMVPRLGMAIQLAQDAKLPHLRFVKPLMDIRKAVQSDLLDRRNMFVHGVHKIQNGEYILTMPRWKGDKRSQTVTLVDAAQLANEIAMEVQKADRIFADYGVWKFGPQQQNDGGQQIPAIKANLRVIRAHQVKRALKLLRANLKFW